MRFVSHAPAMKVGVIPKRAHFTNYGDEIVDQEGYMAEFSRDYVTEADLHFAEKTFLNEYGQIQGQTVLGDEVTPTPFLDRLSVFDTDEMALAENWADRTYFDARGNQIDFKQHVETVLAGIADGHQDFRMIVPLPATPPWPNYMEFKGSLEQLVARLVEDGYDLLEVIRFEEQSGHRQAVIDALRATLAEQQAEIADAVEVPA